MQEATNQPTTPAPRTRRKRAATRPSGNIMTLLKRLTGTDAIVSEVRAKSRKQGESLLEQMWEITALLQALKRETANELIVIGMKMDMPTIMDFIEIGGECWRGGSGHEHFIATAAPFIPVIPPQTITLHQPYRTRRSLHTVITARLLGEMHIRGALHHYRVAGDDGVLYLAPPSWVAPERRIEVLNACITARLADPRPRSAEQWHADRANAFCAPLDAKIRPYVSATTTELFGLR